MTRCNQRQNYFFLTKCHESSEKAIGRWEIWVVRDATFSGDGLLVKVGPQLGHTIRLGFDCAQGRKNEFFG